METESVWDYPRPPRVEPVEQPVRIEFGGVEIVSTERALRVLETSHPPAYYLPVSEFAPGVLVPSSRVTFCEFKGAAGYWSIQVGDRVATDAAWSYPDPSSGYEELADHVSVYAGKVDACWVGDERVEPQAGDFYGGWVTSWVTGPFKGGPGTTGW